MPFRRSFIAGCIFLQMTIIFSATPLNAEEPKSQFEYVESKLGIDYRKMAPSPLAEMLSQGEDEFRNNATSKFAGKTPRYWKGISKSVSKGNISKGMIGRLREYTPLMLQQFAVGLNPQDPKYGYLQSIGALFVSEKLTNLES